MVSGLTMTSGSKYHRKTVVLLLTAHILSLKDVVHRSMFFLIGNFILRYKSLGSASRYEVEFSSVLAGSCSFTHFTVSCEKTIN